MIQNVTIILGTHICIKVVESPIALSFPSKILSTYIYFFMLCYFVLLVFFPLYILKPYLLYSKLQFSWMYFITASIFSDSNFKFVSFSFYLLVLCDEVSIWIFNFCVFASI